MGKVRLIIPAQLARIGVNVDELLLRPWNIDERIPARGRFAQARAKNQEKVRILNFLGQLRIDADTHIASVTGALVVKVVLAPERDRDRQPARLGKGLNPRHGFGIPSAAAKDRKRPFRGGQQLPEPFHVLWRRMRLDALVRHWVPGLGFLAEHILRQS